MCESIEKITLLSVYFLVFYESKKYLKGTLFSLKMQFLINFEAPWRSYNKMTKLHDLTVFIHLRHSVFLPCREFEPEKAAFRRDEPLTR